MEQKPYFAWAYLAQKFGGAVDTLATSFGPNWERMLSVMMELTLLRPDHFPDEDLFRRYQKLHREATKSGPMHITSKHWIGALENTLRRRKRPTFERMAREILSIQQEIEARRGKYEER
jgi:hypothetical protein